MEHYRKDLSKLNSPYVSIEKPRFSYIRNNCSIYDFVCTSRASKCVCTSQADNERIPS